MSNQPKQWYALGDRAVLSAFVDEATAARFASAVRAANFLWLVDVVPAYASVGVYFDPTLARLATVRKALQEVPLSDTTTTKSKLHHIPCCYDFQLDLARIADFLGLSPERVITLHSETLYTIYAIGFCPGFPYLGYLPPELTGVPRLPAPRLRVEPGSVGLTAKQTGLYPLARPGGWNILGRTPLTLVDVAAGYFPLNVGEQVKFERIDQAEFERLKGERL